MQRLRTTLILTLALSGLAVPAQACTTFLCEDGQDVLIGKSYDWHQGAGLVLVNKRGVAKKALVLEPGATPAQWTSRYGSITFNQYGREMPNGGMNTAGLVVEVMWLRASRYPAPDKRPTLNELQWIQYQLDRFATVKEVVEHA
ncbi:MAG: penicillin V acylase-like amidase (Ntn superfamily), partial [Myxococcota bacterium]